ncbi:MAG: aldo/keto reductase, partial [Clostridia bacterium]|nr:aldo/keto reductase [Clostridia bacterium]
ITDIKETSEMVDMFLEAGGTYFDTAFIYPGSEDAMRKALVERYPRESFTLATKLNASIAVTRKAALSQFETSLKRTKAGYFDYYLLHSLMERNHGRYDKFELWDYVKEEKEKGRIKHYGFSFHGGPELLDELLSAHPDVDFVQLQINYCDWESPKVRSRENYEVARKHNKQIVIMEPVKGGSLADPPKEVKEIFDKADPDASYASWAIRFAASLDGILSVLSGMSNIAQMRDNLSYMKDFKPLNEDERSVIRTAQKAFNDVKSIPCTGCGYCTGGCPMNIPIPRIFAARNEQVVFGRIDAGRDDYEAAVKEAGRANACIGCGQCESACPQHLEIIKELKGCSEAFDND